MQSRSTLTSHRSSEKLNAKCWALSIDHRMRLWEEAFSSVPVFSAGHYHEKSVGDRCWTTVVSYMDTIIIDITTSITGQGRVRIGRSKQPQAWQMLGRRGKLRTDAKVATREQAWATKPRVYLVSSIPPSKMHCHLAC